MVIYFNDIFAIQWKLAISLTLKTKGLQYLIYHWALRFDAYDASFGNYVRYTDFKCSADMEHYLASSYFSQIGKVPWGLIFGVSYNRVCKQVLYKQVKVMRYLRELQ